MIAHKGLFFVFQMINVLLLILWLVLTLVALFGLRKRRGLPAVARVLWAIFIGCAPIMGAVAYWIVCPDADQPAE